MAQVYQFSRSDRPNLTNKELSALRSAFILLHTTPDRPLAEIKIEGEWPAAYKGDGLYLKSWSEAYVVATLGKWITVKWRETLTDTWHYVKLPLIGLGGGFTEITFFATRHKEG
jgi:hypothetical protein